MNIRKAAVLAAIAVLAAAFFALDLAHYFDIGQLKQSQAALQAWRAQQPLAAMAVYLALYVGLAGLSIPSGLAMTLAGGAVFGFWWGLVLASFGSSLGGTLAFLLARYVLRDGVSARFGTRLAEIDRGFERDGALYLFCLRLLPLVPFFLINLLMGVTRIRPGTFYWVTQLGTLASTALYVNAGTQLAKLESLSGIWSPELIASFVLLAMFPLVARALVRRIARRKLPPDARQELSER